MRTYYYRLALGDGTVSSGVIKLNVGRDFSARLWLERRYDAIVLRLVPIPGWLVQLGGFFAALRRTQIRREEISAFLRDLSVMLAAGVPMFEALETLAEESESQAMSQISLVARDLLEDLNSGASVSEAFARHPDRFSETIRNLVILGEESGELDKMLLSGAQHLERITKMNRDAKSAMIYPCFVFAAILGASAFWMFYVIPNMTSLFIQMNVKMPELTLAVIAFSDWLLENGKALLIGLVVAVLFIRGLIIRSLKVRKALHALFHRLPIAGMLMYASGMAKITEHLAILVRAGIDMIQCLNILERCTGDEYFRSRIAAMRLIVENGERIGVAMKQVGGFPPMVVRMVSVGEETGTLDRQLAHLAAEYRGRMEILIASLSEILKPVVILVAGGVFIFLISVLFLPIYDLILQVSKR